MKREKSQITSYLRIVSKSQKASKNEITPPESTSNVRKYDAAVSSLYFNLNYGSILTAYALYQAVKDYGLKPALLSKPEKLWTENYSESKRCSDPNSISNLFISKQCDILEFNDKSAADLNSCADIFLVGSDIVWSFPFIGKDAGNPFFLDYVNPEKRKIAYGSSFGADFKIRPEAVNEQIRLLRRFNGIAVKEYEEAEILTEHFGIESDTAVDPLFLCDRKHYIECAQQSKAKREEAEGSFIFASIESCNLRIRQYLLRGNEILAKNRGSALRILTDIKHPEESKARLKLETAPYECVEDYLYYLINSEFVITDNYYTMCMALIFEKPFVVTVNEEAPEIYKFKAILEPLGLTERLVIIQSDLKKKEYLFRKPIKQQLVNRELNRLRSESEEWLKNQLGITNKDEK